MKLVRSVKVAVLDRNGDILILRRSGTHPRAAYEADIPGGEAENDESIEDAASRELLEETGLEIRAQDLKLVYTFTQEFPGVSVNRLLYAVRLDDLKPSVILSSEHDQFSWQPVDNASQVEVPYQKGIDYANKHNLWQDI
jgi:8-oxo-dGTP diphosphatase